MPALYLSLKHGPPPANFGSGSMFDRIATRYDFINRALALNMDTAWRVEMVKAVTSDGKLFAQESKILDLATGTADVAILLANAAREAAAAPATATASSATHVLGVDPSQNMLSVGRDKIKERGLEDIVTLDIGDARNLVGLPTNDFDAATMSFGIRNVPEKDKALCEIWRVMKKDGRSKLGILEFSEPGPEAGILGSVARLFIRTVVPVLGAALSGAPKEYLHLQNSIQEFPPTREIQGTYGRHRLQHVYRIYRHRRGRGRDEKGRTQDGCLSSGGDKADEFRERATLLGDPLCVVTHMYLYSQVLHVRRSNSLSRSRENHCM